MPFYNIILGLAKLSGRFRLMIHGQAVNRSLIRKPTTPTGAGALPTHP
jgi:K+-transporting ATPase A subunit